MLEPCAEGGSILVILEGAKDETIIVPEGSEGEVIVVVLEGAEGEVIGVQEQ